MVGYSFLTAFLLLIAPEANPELITPEVAANLQLICAQQQLVSNEDKRYWFNQNSTFDSDLQVMRRRLKISPTLPPFTRIAHAPTEKDFFGDRMAQALKCKQWFEGDAHLYYSNKAQIEDAKERATYLYNVYYALYMASTRYTCDFSRREHIKQAIELIGPEAFWKGEWPNPVPMEFLEERD